MARIEKISVKNYRVLQDITLKDIKPFSVFLGPNGSGKTTFFDVIGFLSDCLTTNVRKALEKRGRFPEVISRDCKSQEIEIAIQYRENSKSPLITYTVAIGLQNSSPIVSRESLRWKRGPHGKPFDFLKFEYGQGEVISGENPEINDNRIYYRMDDPSSLAIKTIGQLSDNPRVASLRRFIEGWFLSYFIPAQARQLATVGAMEHLSREGDNIANVVQFLADEHPRVLDKILKQLTHRVPQLERVESESTIDGRLALLFKDAPFSRPFLARFASDGTLKLLAYLILLNDPNPPQLLCIEEPENGLHHRLLEPLSEELIAYSQRAQVFVSTHSPFLVNTIKDAKNLWIFQRDKNGYSTVTRADQIPDAKHFIESKAGLGDLWSEGYLRGLPY
ncbi:AAA family ATPase [Aerosakkonemataceae cyanobacterium BLCC-F50]|uniref:AAA family ATPase n=1 Tax=Floridaenema flaviceps BLCC-F50 TaxID=3153642 RepID=A0ABV4XRF5_9CYAN